MTETRKLAPGHMIEVYENHSWKVGRVLKALPGRLFVVKLMEPLGQRTFHQSVIRPWLLWENEAWLHNVEADGDHSLKTGFRVQKKLHLRNQFLELNVEANPGYNEDEQDEADFTPNKLLANNLKRKASSQVQCSYREDVLKTKVAYHKNSSATKKFRHQEVLAESALPVLENVDPFSSNRKLVSEDRVCIFPNKVRINQVAEEAQSIQCSVASNSSINELNYAFHCDNKIIKHSLKESHFDDAQSSCECPNGRQNESFSENEEESKLHQLEIHAYRSTIRAFYASGCLTWGRETLLTNLRLELHISDDEHLSELACLCSTKVENSEVHAYHSTMRAFHASGSLTWGEKPC